MSNDKERQPVTRPIHAHVGDTVQIHWRDDEGNVVIESRTAPPKATPAAVFRATEDGTS